MDKKMQLVLDIMRLSIEISENTEADVFVSYAGHVGELGIMIFYSGWSAGRNANYKKSIYLDAVDYRTEEGIIETLKETYAELADIYEEENNETN